MGPARACRSPSRTCTKSCAATASRCSSCGRSTARALRAPPRSRRTSTASSANCTVRGDIRSLRRCVRYTALARRPSSTTPARSQSSSTPATGEAHSVELFVMVLGGSNYAFAEASPSPTSSRPPRAASSTLGASPKFSYPTNFPPVLGIPARQSDRRCRAISPSRNAHGIRIRDILRPAPRPPAAPTGGSVSERPMIKFRAALAAATSDGPERGERDNFVSFTRLLAG